jgi:hypothetical protein
MLSSTNAQLDLRSARRFNRAGVEVPNLRSLEG